jgi:prepilin-type N-terminal cleavage/methylation domain-containing protein
MRSRFIKAYTLVEMLVALAVSAIIIGATYASYEMVARQYHKNMDIADMHTSGRAIMRIIERDVRMAGFEYRDNNAIITYGSISNPLTIKDSGNKCCDEVTVVYDYFDEESKKSERIRIRYWAEPHTSNKGSRHRLYKQKDILGRNGSVLANPVLGRKEVMADYIEDLQISDKDNQDRFVKIDSRGSKLISTETFWNCVLDESSGLMWEAKQNNNSIHNHGEHFTWWNTDPSINQGVEGRERHYIRQGNSCKGFNINQPSTFCNTQRFTERVNAEQLCGHSDWRVPTLKELNSIVDKTKSYPAANSTFFKWPTAANQPNTFWTNTGVSNKPDTVWFIGFLTGSPMHAEKSGGFDGVNVRLVRKVSAQKGNLININLTLRTKNQYGKDRQFKKQDYHGGNFKIDITDKYKRDTFSTTVLVRNLAL